MTKALHDLFSTPNAPPVRRFYWVDVVRGCAALAILVWHYQHFYFQTAGRNPIVYDRDVQPLHSLLWIFYEEGYFAVQLFWVISGFVFASVYAAKPASGREFFLNRFARLYPLHFATLLIVAGLQTLSFLLQNEYQIYPNNDAYHFVLNLFFVSHWGFEEGDSFNAPIWSVSVEVFIYIVFWLVHRWLFKRGMLGPALLTAAFGLLFVLKIPGRFWECGFLFFLGTMTYVWIAHIRDRGYLSSGPALVALVLSSYILIREVEGLGDITRAIFFVSLIVFAAALDLRDSRQHGSKVSWVGDITYSLYLLHVPVQIAVLLMMDGFGINRSIVASPVFLLTFIVSMILIAQASYRWFELPMRQWIRQSFKRKSEPLSWQRVELSKD